MMEPCHRYADDAHVQQDGSAAWNGAWKRLGTVKALRIRPGGSSDPVEVSELTAVQDLGLDGDKHAHALSPRQVLIAGEDVYQDLQLAPHTLRENLLVSFATKELKSSCLIKIGQDVVLWLTFQCEACGHLEVRSPGIVRSLKGRRGVLARVLRAGRIAVGDDVSQGPSSIAPIPEHWKERVIRVLHSVPDDKRVEFRQLARLAGVPKSYCRVFPKVLSELPRAVASRAQAGEVADARLRWSGHELFDVRAQAPALASFD